MRKCLGSGQCHISGLNIRHTILSVISSLFFTDEYGHTANLIDYIYQIIKADRNIILNIKIICLIDRVDRKSHSAVCISMAQTALSMSVNINQRVSQE